MIPLAGQNRILNFLSTPLGEELGEGIMTGGVAGLSQVGSDTTPQEIALKTVGAIAGGVGLGIAGRRIGAAIGKRINPNALKDQEGALATFGRVAGSETTMEGAKRQAQVLKNVVQESLVNETSAAMLEQALENPNLFAEKYGVTADEFKDLIPYVKKGRMAASAAKTFEMYSEKEKHDLVHNLKNTYKQVEQAVVTNAANNIDSTIKKAVDNPNLKDMILPGTNKSASQMFESLLNAAPPVTGENVGRAIGRFAGDEIGVLAGLSAASALAGPLGMQSPKDIKIKKLEQDLQQKNN